MKKAFIATAAGALILGAAVPALAQTERPTGLDVRLGIVTPTDQNIKDLSDSWLGFGVDYRLWHGSNASVALSMDYAGKGQDRNVPIVLNFIGHAHQFYAFAGAGIGFLRDNDQNLTSFAYEGGVGYDFQATPNSLFIEAKYIGSSDANVNGVGVYLGFRF